MVDRAVVVRLIADNRSFDSAMVASGKRVKDVGTEAHIVGDVGTQAFSRLRTAAVTFLGVGLLSAGQNMINLKQQAQIAFTSMTGDAQKASAQIQQIYEWDQKVPVPFQNALAAGQKLAAFGLDLKDIVPTLGSIADATGAVGGTAETFDRIALAIGQIQTKGKLSAEEMLQLAESGLPAWQILADQLGISIPEAMKETQRGAIDADTAITALRDGIEKRFPGAAEKMKETTVGAWASIQAGARNAAEAILAPLQQTEQQGFLTGKALLEAAGSGIGATLQGTMSLFSGLNGLLGVTEDSSKSISPVLSATVLAMLGTHAGAQKLEAGWSSLKSTGESLALRTMYMSDAVKASGSIMGATRLAVMSMGAAAATAGRGMMAAFGGPLGLAIIGTTTALSIWGNAQQEARQKEQDHIATLSDLKDTFDRVSGAITGSTRAKIIDQWADSIKKTFQGLGIDFDLAVDAAVKGGPAMDVLRDKVRDLEMSAVQSTTGWQNWSKELAAAGITTSDLIDRSQADAERMLKLADIPFGLYDEAQAAIMPYADALDTVTAKQADLNQVSSETRSRFEDLAAQAAIVGGVTKDQMITALDQAKTSGGTVEGALNSLGISTSKFGEIVSTLGDTVRDGSYGMHLMAGAASEAGSAMSAAGDGAADGADKISAASARAAKAMQAQLEAALALRQMVSTAVIGFVDPLGAWDAAVAAANPPRTGGGGSQKKSGKSPAELAAEAALKAGKIQAEGTKKSAKAEQAAAIKAAAKIRDAIKSRADADLKAARTAEKNARDRVTAAKKEADELKRIADDAAKQATDAQSRLDAAQFAKRAADVALQAAQAGLASAKSPDERASWERAVANALADQATATANLTQAQQTATQTEQAAAASKQASANATATQTQAENDYQAAQDHTAQVSETTSARKTAADNTYTTAKEKADARYQKSVDAVNSKLDALTTAQDKARESAQKMADGASSAVGGMTKKITPSLDQYLGQLRTQVQAQQTWADNLISLSSKVGPGVAGELVKLGPTAAPLVQRLVNGTDSQLKEFSQLFPKSTDTGTQLLQARVLAAIAPTQLAMTGFSTAAIKALTDGLTSPTTQSELDAAMGAVTFAMQAGADKTKVTVDLGITSDNADSWLRTWMQKKTSAIGSTFGSMTVGNIKVKGGMYADGGAVGDGWFTVGERGPELGYKQGNQTRIFSNPESQRMIPAPAPAGPQIVINQYMTAYYPQAEPTSVATNRELAVAGALGGLL